MTTCCQATGTCVSAGESTAKNWPVSLSEQALTSTQVRSAASVSTMRPIESANTISVINQYLGSKRSQ